MVFNVPVTLRIKFLKREVVKVFIFNNPPVILTK